MLQAMPIDPQSTPTVTVIIPAYNTEAYLGAAIESVLDQTLQSFEIIVIDDGSTDGTAAVAESFQDARIRVFRLGENQGPSAARNKGFEAAQGTWIAVLDSDDWMSPDRLSVLLTVADEERADMVADDLFMINDGEDIPFMQQFPSSGYVLPERFTVDPVAFVNSNKEGLSCLRLGLTQPLFRRAFLEKYHIRYDTEIRYCEDVRLTLKCLLSGAHFVILSEPHYYRRRRAGAITMEDPVAFNEEALLATPRYLQEPYIRQHPDLIQALLMCDRHRSRFLAFLKLKRFFRQSRWGDLFLNLGLLPSAFSYVTRRLYHGLLKRTSSSTIPLGIHPMR